MYTEVILHVSGVLWLKHYSHVHLPFVAYHPHHHLHVVSIGAILRVSTQVIIKVVAQRVGQQAEIVVP